MEELDRRASQQCLFLRDHYRPCLPRGCRSARFDLSFVSSALGVAIAELVIPYADSEVVLTAHFEGQSRLPDIAWRHSSQSASFFPQIDFPALLAADVKGPSELMRIVGALILELSRFHEDLLPRQSCLWRAWRALADHEVFRHRSRFELLVNRPADAEKTAEASSKKSSGDHEPDLRTKAAPPLSKGDVESVTLAFTIPLDYASLPAFLMSDNVGEDFECCLLFKFTRPTLNGGLSNSPLSAEAVERVSPRLYLSPSLRTFLQTVGFDLRLPHFNVSSAEERCDDQEERRPVPGQLPSQRLLDYALFVHENLQVAVSRACNSCDARRRILSALVHRLRGAVLEFDAELYRSAAFLLEWHDFYFVLRFQLQEYFPHQQEGPQICLRSIYHTVPVNAGNGAEEEGESGSVRQPFERNFQQEVPHSPRWEAQEFADRWLRFVREALPKFQADSVRNNSI